ncbi:hypothetical protein SCHPADRAFT_347622 [Schizopora paradoxa]|uniref:DUF6534 domain-containing protein n=1 Tax=Schizopora paradoxa TaxID=27342 RepID=A0A0H2SAA1_9AGAM|nr:hypothetical protein SCHPADRAFT_347622 [Schizopora paradoxa]
MGPTIDNTVGAVLVGCFLSCMLFGVTILQSVCYFQSNKSRSDGRFIFVVVIASIFLDVVLTILICHGTYIYTVRSVENPGNLITTIPWSYRPLSLIIGISESVVRCFFVRRIWILSNRNLPVTSLQVALMVVPLGIAVPGAAIQIINLHTLDQLPKMTWIIYSTMFSDMLADISIASTSCYFLYRSNAGVTGSTDLFNTLIIFVIGTGSITVIFSRFCDIVETILVS